MTRQYIGARYVPKFFTDENGSSEWRDSIPYEALTVVMYLGNSYTSKKPVPIGVQIDNAEYWALTGNYNAQVESYREDVIELTERISPILNKKYVVIGDSYGIGGSQSGHTYTPYPIFASNFTGATIFNLSESGAGFANIGDSGHNFEGLLSTIDNSVDRSTITDVIVLGGFNDRIHEQSEIYSAMTRFRNACNNLFVNAKISVGFIGWCIGAPDYLLLQRAKIAYQNCSQYGAKYLSNIEYVMHDFSYFDEDGIHPNNEGQIALGIALSEIIYNGCVSNIYKPRANVGITPLNGVVFSNAITQKLDNNILGWGWYDDFNIGNMNVFETHTLNGTEWFEVGKLETNIGYGRGYFGMNNTVPCVVVMSDNLSYTGLVTFRIVNGAIACAIVVTDNDNQFLSGTMKSITIKPEWFTTSASDN